jgi:hypothetical protein
VKFSQRRYKIIVKPWNGIVRLTFLHLFWCIALSPLSAQEQHAKQQQQQEEKAGPDAYAGLGVSR